VYHVGIRPHTAGGQRGSSLEHYTWHDLAVGRTVLIFGREMLLTSADEFTRLFYKEHAGMSDSDFEPIEVCA
jgi:hypothetical protein